MGPYKKSEQVQGWPTIVDQPAAACLLLRQSDFEMVSGFDTEFFPAWFEDVDFLKRLFNKHRYAALVPLACAVHEGGYSKKNVTRERICSSVLREPISVFSQTRPFFRLPCFAPSFPLGHRASVYRFNRIKTGPSRRQRGADSPTAAMVGSIVEAGI